MAQPRPHRPGAEKAETGSNGIEAMRRGTTRQAKGAAQASATASRRIASGDQRAENVSSPYRAGNPSAAESSYELQPPNEAVGIIGPTAQANPASADLIAGRRQAKAEAARTLLAPVQLALLPTTGRGSGRLAVAWTRKVIEYVQEAARPRSILGGVQGQRNPSCWSAFCSRRPAAQFRSASSRGASGDGSYLCGC